MLKFKIKKNGQVILEFIFCMIIVLLLIYAAIMIFRWSGLDLAYRRSAHDHVLLGDVDTNWGRCINEVISNLTGFPTCVQYGKFTDGPVRQIDPYFYKPISMNAVWINY